MRKEQKQTQEIPQTQTHHIPSSGNNYEFKPKSIIYLPRNWSKQLNVSHLFHSVKA